MSITFQPFPSFSTHFALIASSIVPNQLNHSSLYPLPLTPVPTENVTICNYKSPLPPFFQKFVKELPTSSALPISSRLQKAGGARGLTVACTSVCMYTAGGQLHVPKEWAILSDTFLPCNMCKR